MDKYVVMCRSLSYAQRGQRLLVGNNIAAYIIKAPQSVSLEGCSYGLRIKAADVDKVVIILKSAGIKVGKIFRVDAGGIFSEVSL